MRNNEENAAAAPAAPFPVDVAPPAAAIAEEAAAAPFPLLAVVAPPAADGAVGGIDAVRPAGLNVEVDAGTPVSFATASTNRLSSTRGFASPEEDALASTRAAGRNVGWRERMAQQEVETAGGGGIPIISPGGVR